MIIWNIYRLEDKIASHLFEEKDALSYTISNLAFWTFMSYIGFISAKEKLNWQFVCELLVMLVIMTWGIIKCYRINVQIDNARFAERFFSIYFVMVVRFVVFITVSICLLLLIIIFTYNSIEKLNDIMHISWIYLTLAALIQILFYYLIYKSFKRLQVKHMNFNAKT